LQEHLLGERLRRRNRETAPRVPPLPSLFGLELRGLSCRGLARQGESLARAATKRIQRYSSRRGSCLCGVQSSSFSPLVHACNIPHLHLGCRRTHHLSSSTGCS